MQQRNLWGGVLWLVLGVALCIGSISAGLGNSRVPGTGFFPFVVGTFMALFAILLIASSRSVAARSKPVVQDPLRLSELKLPAATLIILLSYVVLLEHLGFLLTTFLCLLSLFKLSNPKKWRMPLFLSGIAVGTSYLVFVLWLRNPFPTGILGF